MSFEGGMTLEARELTDENIQNRIDVLTSAAGTLRSTGGPPALR